MLSRTKKKLSQLISLPRVSPRPQLLPLTAQVNKVKSSLPAPKSDAHRDIFKLFVSSAGATTRKLIQANVLKTTAEINAFLDAKKNNIDLLTNTALPLESPELFVSSAGTTTSKLAQANSVDRYNYAYDDLLTNTALPLESALDLAQLYWQMPNVNPGTTQANFFRFLYAYPLKNLIHKQDDVINLVNFIHGLSLQPAFDFKLIEQSFRLALTTANWSEFQIDSENLVLMLKQLIALDQHSPQLAEQDLNLFATVFNRIYFSNTISATDEMLYLVDLFNKENILSFITVAPANFGFIFKDTIKTGDDLMILLGLVNTSAQQKIIDVFLVDLNTSVKLEVNQLNLIDSQQKRLQLIEIIGPEKYSSAEIATMRLSKDSIAMWNKANHLIEQRATEEVPTPSFRR